MAKLSSAELAKREDVIMKMKKNKRGLVKRYGSDAEKVMYGRATNIAKKVAETQMENLNLKELVRAALMQEKAGFSKEFDSDPALKGGQKNLPDGLQKAIISKTKSANEDLDLGHEDDEPHMLKSDLYHIGKYAMNLYQMVDQFEGKGEVDFPHWWQSKIIKAKEMMSSAKHYLDFELKEPEIDAAVDVIDASNALNSTDINEATKMYYHVIEDVDGEKGWQGAYDTQDEAEKRADKLQDMFPKSFFYVEAYDSASEPYNITLEEGLPKGYFKKATDELDESVSEGIGTIALGIAGGLLLLRFLKFAVKKVIGTVGMNRKLPKEKLLEILEETYERIYSQSGSQKYIHMLILSPVKDFLKDEINAGRITTVKQVVDVIEKASNKEPKKNESVNESYEVLVKKIKGQGKSEKAAKAIAGAVASYKAKGGGKGPTVKQKARG
jgi:hypothetical protein